jgi:tape measure domain-containing protein
MAAQPNTLQTRFTANIVQFENELRRLQRLNQRAAANVAAAHQRAAAQSNNAWANSNIGGALQRSMAGIGPMLKQYAGLIAGMFAGREAYNAVETYQRFANSLKVAGLEGATLDGVQKQLYDSAIKNGVALEPLGQLYARASQSAKELGANQGSLIKFTDGVTSALRVAGASTESASGALMQLSQLLASGTVHAEEFNSVNEGARPILEAVAKGNDKYAGSVSKLRAEVLKGKVSSREFFNDFLAGSASLEAQAAKAPLTVAASMTNLQTALTRYIGEANESWGITDKVTYAIKMMADNFDVLAKSVGVVGGVYAATFIPGIVRGTVALGVGTIATLKSTAATITDTVALVTRTAAIYGISTASATATVATRALGTALAFFGGPVGLAIMAVGAAVAYLGVTSAKAALETNQLNERINANAAAMDEAHKASVKKRAETGNLTDQEYRSAVATASLTGEVGKLKNAYYLAAAAAKTLAVEQARVEMVSANKDQRKAREGYHARLDSELATERNRGGMQSGAERGMGTVGPLTPAQIKAAKVRAASSEEGQLFLKAGNVNADRQREYQRQRGSKLEEFGAAAVAPAEPKKTGKKGGSKSKPKDPTDASADAIDAAERAYQQAMQNSAETAEERHGYALTLLKMDRDDQVKQLDRRAAEGDITKAAAASAKALVEKTYLQSVENADNVKRDEVAARENEITEQSVAMRADGLKLEADRLDGLADASTDMRARHRFEREALAKRQSADDEAFRVQQDLLARDRMKRGYTRE